MFDLLTPQTRPGPLPADPDSARYVRSYLFMRVFIGVLGVALPFLVVLCDGLWFDGDPFPRDSLSAYYYSGAREFFVGGLCATGVFLANYKVAERTLDNTLSWLAGVAAVVVALFPTGRPDDPPALTPLQRELGEGLVQAIHYGAAATFILSLAVICFFFGVREGARPPREGKRSPAFWRRYHWGCAGAICAAVLFIAGAAIAGGVDRSLLYGEAISVWAFGASWFMKGLELDILRRNRGDAAPAADAARG